MTEIVLALVGGIGGLVGWQLRALLDERARYRAEEQRDAQWDRRHLNQSPPTA